MFERVLGYPDPFPFRVSRQTKASRLFWQSTGDEGWTYRRMGIEYAGGALRRTRDQLTASEYTQTHPWSPDSELASVQALV